MLVKQTFFSATLLIAAISVFSCGGSGQPSATSDEQSDAGNIDPVVGHGNGITDNDFGHASVGTISPVVSAVSANVERSTHIGQDLSNTQEGIGLMSIGLMSIELLEATKEQVHSTHRPIQALFVGQSVLMQAVFLQRPRNLGFRVISENGRVLSGVTVSPLPADVSPVGVEEIYFYGHFDVPNESFKISISGIDENGVSFERSWPKVYTLD